MPGLLSGLLDSDALTPHGFCLSWQPGLMALHVVSDTLIAASYYSIPLAIALLLLRRSDVVFGWMGWLFAAFIVACGTTHALDVWTLWHPDYLADGLVKAVTAAVSVFAAAVLWPLLPKLVALPSPGILLESNARLQWQIRERDEAVAALHRETSERQKAEAIARQSQKMEAIGQLTGGIAHDFNNLLMAIQANLEVLEGRLEAADPRKKYVQRALTGTGRAGELTQQLLSFARRQALEPTDFAVDACVDSVTRLLSGTLGMKIALVVRHQRGLWPAEADPHQLETALINLAVNACDAMPEGGQLTVETANVVLDSAAVAGQEDFLPGDYVAITMTDTGTGMTREVREAAFEPFFTTKPIGKGTGLGLSQVYGFAKQSRGHVTLASEPGQGTTVTIYLRRGRPDSAVPPAAERR
jgi:signal transduction histidine kinase